MEDPADAQEGPYGSLYTMDVELSFKGRRAVVRTIWIIKPVEDLPRLVTCHIL